MKLKFSVLMFMLATMTAFGATGVFAQDDTVPADTPVLLQGQLMDTDGTPIAGAVVEIWQTDINGNYDHPQASAESDLLADFQYFGTAVTDDEGYYAFLTVKPGQYEPRAVHIHFKVKIDGYTLLTSQFYFEEDLATLSQDGIFNSGDETLLLPVEDTTDDNGDLLRVATGNIVLDVNGNDANTLPATAEQTEGPYYPVVDFSEYDNDLLNAETDEDPVLPMLSMDTATEFTLFNLNTATEDDFLSIPNMNNRMVREFNEYRPYISILQFRREIGKYVGDDVVAGYEAYIYVPVDFNASDTATLMQIPGIDEATADALIAARPFADSDAFFAAVSELAPDVDIAYAMNYLPTE